MMKLPYWSFLLLAALSLSCRPSTNTGFSIDYEKYSLDNGLEVVFHIDRSDPIVAVAMTYHVGSARERPGKTGFAHLFEHLLFLESENLGKGGLDILINKVGGTLNGSTNRDRTNYYQVVPNDALEKILWAEADKLGFFINTVTAPVVEKEKQVVKNEKRQGVDNRPYGHTNYVIDKNLYPEGHPYNWQVIGSLEDLQNASLEDVHEFYRAWYAPNNATLVLAGDFDVVQAKEWVEKYFGEIPAVELHPQDPVEQPTLTETTRLFHEDNFARLPALTIAWPTVAQYHPDTYPLQLLSLLLTDGKKAPFYKVLVEDRQLTSNVSMFNQNSELAGKTTLSIRAFAGTDLDEVDAAVNEAFARFETDGFTEADLARVKARVETSFYNGMASVLGKAFRLAQYNIFAGDPGYAAEDIQRLLDVTHEDVLRVYDHYIKDKHYICTSFVPRGQTDLMLAESRQAEVVEEQIIAGAEEEFLLTGSGPIEKTPSSFDRSIEPSFGSSPEISIPEIWTDHLDNGMRLFGIENDELPLVQFTLRMRGGLLLDNPDKIGVANMVTDVMMEGTRTKTPEELEAAIDELGASISIQAGRETITVRGNTLARNYEQTMALVEEILLEPRWDEKEFDLVKQRTLDNLRQQAANPNAIAANVYNKLLYGEDHIFSNNILGTIESVESINI
ncbi:MAG: M16 family metallopeptidase, partial [Rhodothermales bacterium]